MQTRIGFIGLGIMGKPMAHNLLRAGYPVIGYSRTPTAVQALVANGARAAASPRAVAEQAEVVISIVTDTPDVRDVILAPRVIDRDFTPGFMVKLQQKDLRLVLQEAEHLKLALPATSLVHTLFQALEARGAGDEGTQALVKVLEALAGVEVKE